MELETKILQILSEEKDKFFPKWVKEKDLEKVKIENVIAYLKGGELKAFIKLEPWENNVVELDWVWIHPDDRNSKEVGRFIFEVFKKLSQRYVLESTFFEYVKTPVIKLSTVSEKRYITAFRFPEIGEKEIPPGIKHNGLYAIISGDFGYAKEVYELYFTYGIDFIIVDLPFKPFRDYMPYYSVVLDPKIIDQKWQKFKKYPFKGEIKTLNLSVPF
jgi:hypothetical protein